MFLSGIQIAAWNWIPQRLPPRKFCGIIFRRVQFQDFPIRTSLLNFHTTRLSATGMTMPKA